MINEAAVASRSGAAPARGGTSVEKLAQFFPEAVAMRLPVRVTALPPPAEGQSGTGELGSQTVKSQAHARYENTTIEFGTAQEVLFASSLPLEFDDRVRLENVDGSLQAEALVVALQYHHGHTAVAARFTREVANWIIKR